jgi:hypothetical protein
MGLERNREGNMKVKIQQWVDHVLMVFIRKHKNTKRPNVYLREGGSFEIDIKHNKCLNFWNTLIEIQEYDCSTRLYIWQQIKREI